METAPTEPKEAPPGVAGGAGSFRSRPGNRASLELLAAAAAYVAATAALFWPFIRDMSHALLGPPEDNMQDLWNTWYGVHALASRSGDFFHTTWVRFPEGTSLHHHSFSFPHLFVVAAVRRLFALPLDVPTVVTLHNAALLLAIPAAALGARAMARRLGADAAGALLAGFLFAFGSFELAQIQHHVHVSQIEFIPWFVVALWNALDRGRWHRLLAAAALLALCALSSWYYLVYGGLLVAFEVARSAARRDLGGLRVAAGRSAAIVLCAATLLAPWIVPMIRESIGNPGSLEIGHDVLVADLASWIAFPSHHVLAGLSETLRATFTGNPWEVEVYLGVVALGLFAWAFAMRRRLALEPMPYLLAAMLFFAVVASGSTLRVAGRAVAPAPARLVELLPFAQNARTPARAAVFVQLFLAAGVGLAVTALRARVASRAARRVATVLAGAALVADSLPLGMPSTAIEPPPAYASIARDPETDFGILDLPLGYLPGNLSMLFQVFHGRPIVSATLSRRVSPSLADRLRLDDLRALRAQLAGAKVKYVVLHLDLLSYARWARTPAEANAVQDGYARSFPMVFADGDTSVFRVY